MRDEPPPAEPVDLLERTGSGPLWGIASSDLNATLLVWPAGHEIAEHVNAELDVLVIVLSGRGSATVDGATHDLGAGAAHPARGTQAHHGRPARPALRIRPPPARTAADRGPARPGPVGSRGSPLRALIVVGT